METGSRRYPFRLQRNFFGLNPQDRVDIFAEIHDIVFHGQGGYDWDTVYKMPVWLRKFTLKKLQEFYKKKNANPDELNADNIKDFAKNMPDIAKPPVYSTKMSKPK